MAGSGWCNHPRRRPSSDVMLMVRRNELACRNTWDDDLWEAPLAASNPNGHGPPKEARAIVPIRPERPATEDEIAAALSARSLMPELEIPDPAREDVVVGEGPSMRLEPRPRAMAADRRPDLELEPEPEQDDRATILAQDTRAAIFKARERHRSRAVTRTRPMELPLHEPATMPTPEQPSAAEAALEPSPIASPDAESMPAATARFDAPEARVPPDAAATSPAASSADQRAAAPAPDLPFRPERPGDGDRFDSVPERRTDVELPRPTAAPRTPLVAGLDDDVDSAPHRPARRIVPPPPDRRLPDPVRPVAAAPSRPVGGNRDRAEERDRIGRDRPRDQVRAGSNGVERATAETRRPVDAPALYREVEPECPPTEAVLGAELQRRNGARAPLDPRSAPPVAHDPPPSFGAVAAGQSRFVAADTVVPTASVIGVAGGDEIDDAMLDLTVQIAPLVPRMCRTCRDFKPADDDGRGWCTSRWAFNHRRSVDATKPEPPCQTSIGCWWLPSDRVWADAADVSDHGSPTPLLEHFMPHLFAPRERPAPTSRRRQS